ncbi:hypothetical protein Val02_13200 [Virgisporangium aliadipatigenens]|uniref:Uncharacterized protein n=1 Tax=Virgisporangium aliadipatigenens TaxID=741659 RepID=A0A8J3YFW5_9ACTN|nr:hypothetical protein [Virgisporangium aliadipatigenens]GIJ44434.1 hypothetical protein Val02_13200 [Virgisporangium aliadipatigenens]
MTIVVTLPSLIMLVMSWDGVHERVSRFCRRQVQRHRPYRGLTIRQRRRLARLDRTLSDRRVSAWPVCQGPPIETIAIDLRRLRRQRDGVAQRSPVWFTAVEKAYDERLGMACERLDIEAHIEELTGIDREIERVRVEGELEAAGLRLGPVAR